MAGIRYRVDIVRQKVRAWEHRAPGYHRVEQ